MRLMFTLLLLAVSSTLVAQTSPPTQNPAPNAGATITAPQTNLTGTAITACGSITSPGSYYLSGNLSCPGTALLLSGPGIDLNLNGYTITYGTAGGTLGQVYGIENDACWDTGDTHGAIAVPCDTASNSAGATIYNGYIVQSANAPGFSHSFFFGQNNNGNSRVIDIHDVDITMQQTGTQAFYGGVAGQNLFEHNTIHDNVVSIDLPGQGDLSARSAFQGQAVMVDDSTTTASPDQLDNNLIIGSPQGGLRDTSTGALIFNNDISMNSTYTNDFCVDVPGTDEQVYDNYCHPVNGRGIHVNGIGGNIYGNLIIVTEAAVNAEYDGCEGGGAYGIQLEADIQAAGGSVVTDNNSTVNTGACGGGALRMTGWAGTSPATISNNIWTINKTAGADEEGDYDYFFDADQLNDVTFGPNEQLISNGNACIGIDWDGETGLNVAMPTCHAPYMIDSENGNNDPTYGNTCDNCNSSFTITQAANTNLLCGQFATTTGTINGTPVQCPESAAASITVVSGSGQSAAVGTPFANPLEVLVEDANSNPMPNVTVSFSGTNVSFPSGATAVTNSGGEAEVTAEPTSAGSLTITANTSGASTSATFTETGTGTSTAVLKSITLTGTGPGTTVHLKAAATSPAVIQFSSSNPNVISAPATVIVPTGATSVAVGTLLGSLWTPAGSAETATLSATLNGVTKTLAVNLYSPSLHSFACKPASCPAVAGGQPYNFTLELSGTAPAGGGTVQITSSNPAVIPSQTVAIPAGQDEPATSPVSITTNSVTATATVTVTATFNGTTISVGPITVNPVTAVKSVTSDGAASPGTTVNLTTAAPTGGLVVQISSSDQSVAYAPATVTVPAGQTSAEIGTLLGSLFGPAGASQSATISATYNSVTKSLAKTYTTPSVSTFGCITTPCPTVEGGQTTGFNLALSKSAAPIGGATVTITSDSPAVIPTQTVQISAGQNSPASVPVLINTNTVTANTVVKVTASYNGDTKNATGGAITVTPQLPPASVAAVSGSGQSVMVGTSFANPLVVLVEDTNDKPVQGVTVNFAGTGVSFPSGATATTNSSGEAQVTAQPTSVGALTVTASVTGVSTPASFAETGISNIVPVAFGQANACSGSGTSITCSYTIAVAAGELLIANVAPSNTTGSAYTMSVSDNLNGAWTQGVECFSAYNTQADFFYLPNSVAGSVTVTVTSSTSTSFKVAIGGYTGVAASNPVDVNGTCSALALRAASITAPSVTTTNANDLILNMLATGTPGTLTASSPYTLRIANFAEAFADQSVSSAGTYTGTTFNWTYTNNTFVIAAAFKGAN